MTNWSQIVRYFVVRSILFRSITKHSLTGKRSDLRPQAVPSLFPWTTQGIKWWEGKEIRKKRGSENDKYAFKLKKRRLDGDELLDVNEMKRENDLHSEDQSEVIAYVKRQLELSKVGIERFKSSADHIFFYTGFPNYDTLMAFNLGVS